MVVLFKGPDYKPSFTNTKSWTRTLQHDMSKKVHFRTKADYFASSKPSPVTDAASNGTTTAGKRNTGNITRGTMATKNAEKWSKRRKVSVYDAVAGD